MQGIKEGFQVELPDIWLTNGNPWELKRPGIKYPVGFYGSVVGGKWQPEEKARPRTAGCAAHHPWHSLCGRHGCKRIEGTSHGMSPAPCDAVSLS